MSVEMVGIIVILSVFLLLFLRIPIVVSMAIPACLGIIYLKDFNVLFAIVDSVIWEQSYSYTLSTIPLFVLMGNLLFSAGFSNELFTAFRNWFGRFKGGLSLATIASSGMFAAASGSSVATTGTMGVIASREMLNAGYSKVLTGGTIVAGGTLGILIPPSTMLIIYGVMTQQSIGKLLLAGIIPGILLVILFMITISISIMIKPDLVQEVDEREVSWKEKFTSLKANVWIIILFIIVIGGIYTGILTATESAGVGALGAFLIALIRRKLTLQNFTEALFSTIKTTGFLFAIVLGAFILNFVLTITRVPHALTDFLFSQNLSPLMIFILLVVMYIFLGMIMSTFAMVVVTIPIVLPLIQLVGFDLIWFGVIIVLIVEMALITPPIGMNTFVLKSVADDLELNDIFKGAFIFLIPILVLIALLYIFPEIALFLPNAY